MANLRGPFGSLAIRPLERGRTHDFASHVHTWFAVSRVTKREPLGLPWLIGNLCQLRQGCRKFLQEGGHLVRIYLLTSNGYDGGDDGEWADHSGGAG